MSSPFINLNTGLPPNLIPNPPGTIPEAPGAGDATPKSPFIEALDMEAIFANLILDRPLKLFIPNKERYPDFEFRIINSIPQEIAAAHNKGFRQVTDPELTGLFNDLVAGTDKEGKAYRPLLFARPRAVGDHVRHEQRKQLRSIYAGMDPSNKDLSTKYTKNVGDKDGTAGSFSGAGWRIQV